MNRSKKWSLSGRHAAHWLQLVSLVAGLLPLLASGQPARLHDVKAWRGTFTAKAHTQDSRSGRGWEGINPWSATSTYNGYVTVEFLLDEFEDEPAVWRGRVIRRWRRTKPAPRSST